MVLGLRPEADEADARGSPTGVAITPRALNAEGDTTASHAQAGDTGWKPSLRAATVMWRAAKVGGNEHATGLGSLVQKRDPGPCRELDLAARGGGDSGLQDLNGTVHGVAAEQSWASKRSRRGPIWPAV